MSAIGHIRRSSAQEVDSLQRLRRTLSTWMKEFGTDTRNVWGGDIFLYSHNLFVGMVFFHFRSSAKLHGIDQVRLPLESTSSTTEHLHCTQLSTSGFNAEQVMSNSGHKNVDVYVKYLQTSPETNAQINQGIGQIVSASRFSFSE